MGIPVEDTSMANRGAVSGTVSFLTAGSTHSETPWTTQPLARTRAACQWVMAVAVWSPRQPTRRRRAESYDQRPQISSLAPLCRIQPGVVQWAAPWLAPSGASAALLESNGWRSNSQDTRMSWNIGPKGRHREGVIGPRDGGIVHSGEVAAAAVVCRDGGEDVSVPGRWTRRTSLRPQQPFRLL